MKCVMPGRDSRCVQFAIGQVDSSSNVETNELGAWVRASRRRVRYFSTSLGKSLAFLSMWKVKYGGFSAIECTSIPVEVIPVRLVSCYECWFGSLSDLRLLIRLRTFIMAAVF